VRCACMGLALGASRVQGRGGRMGCVARARVSRDCVNAGVTITRGYVGCVFRPHFWILGEWIEVSWSSCRQSRQLESCMVSRAEGFRSRSGRGGYRSLSVWAEIGFGRNRQLRVFERLRRQECRLSRTRVGGRGGRREACCWIFSRGAFSAIAGGRSWQGRRVRSSIARHEALEAGLGEERRAGVGGREGREGRYGSAPVTRADRLYLFAR